MIVDILDCFGSLTTTARATPTLLPKRERVYSRVSRSPYGPNGLAGVWLGSGSSVTQVKFAAMLVLPLPLYFATFG